MPGWTESPDDMSRFAEQLKDMMGKIRDLSAPKPFIIAVLSADPPDTDPTNMWVLPDGRIRFRYRNPTDTAWVYREVISTSPGSGSSGTAPAPSKPAPKTYTTSWSASAMEDYHGESGSSGLGTKRTDYSDRLYYGYGDSYNGRNRSILIFPSSIATTLSGATIKSVQLTLFNEYTWQNSGATMYFSIHNQGSVPTTFTGNPAANGKRYIASAKVRRNTTHVINLPVVFGQALRDGWGRGITIEAINNSQEQYGYVAGSGSGHAVPAIKVQYIK